MKLVLIGLTLTALAEIAIWIRPLWRLRGLAAGLLIPAISCLTGILLAVNFTAWSVIFAIFSLYRVVNLARIIQGRIHETYLYYATQKTSLWLLDLQAITAFAGILVQRDHINILTCFYVLSGVQLLAAIIIFLSTARHIRTTSPPEPKAGFAKRDLPSLTIAIPARNETADLEDCLDSLLASDYPKLEILVLDDCSQNKRTSEIIRGFAQQGVRFIAGEAPPEGWLAKNFAYQQLVKNANGELIMFCGVDTRFEPQSVTSLVTVMLQKEKTMVSVMPKNILQSEGKWGSLLVQPARYAWELALPRRLLSRPPVLSTCWLISRESLEKAGGFAAVSRKVIPESYFAKFTSSHRDGYSLQQAGGQIGVSSVKSFANQRATTIRTRYPQLHRRPELAACLSLVEFAVLIWPAIIAAVAGITGEPILAILTGLAAVLTIASHARIVNLTYRNFTPAGLFVLPFSALYDIALLNYSMWLYEFDEVIWKGRNVCMPVMKAYPSLPDPQKRD